MKVSDLTAEQLQKEKNKTIRVRARGDRDIYVGYYNHLRRRGGDVFILRPVIRKRFDKKTNRTTEELITAEQQFSERWMEKVTPRTPETAPIHFNQAGKGRKRLDIPGMTNKIGGDDNLMEGAGFPEEGRESQYIKEQGEPQETDGESLPSTEQTVI